MNFLGHCYLCQDNPSLITGNLGGDFYKGKLEKFNTLPKHILGGLKHHRFIDSYTDQSAAIIKAAHIFQQNGIAKVSYIACDILIDHCLAKNWGLYSPIAYTDFIGRVYRQVDKDLQHMPPEFRFLFSKMKEYRWLFGYPTREGIGLTLSQFSNRLAFPNNLKSALEVYLQHETELENIFKSFLNDIKTASDDFILGNSLNIS
jgi:acyl carrier protein phosphodiesterase